MQIPTYISTPTPKKVSPAEEIGIKSFRQVMDEHLAACKAWCRKKRKGSGQYTNSDPFIKFLRQRVSRLNSGEKIPGLGVRAELDEKRLTDRYNRRRFGAALGNDQFFDHSAGDRTYYF
jgi:hypothetical protein